MTITKEFARVLGPMHPDMAKAITDEIEKNFVPMENIEHVISWHGLSDNKWHTQVVFKPGMGNTICSCQGKIPVTDQDFGR